MEEFQKEEDNRQQMMANCNRALTLTRTATVVASANPVYIYVNGVHFSTLANGETQKILVPDTEFVLSAAYENGGEDPITIPAGNEPLRYTISRRTLNFARVALTFTKVE